MLHVAMAPTLPIIDFSPFLSASASEESRFNVAKELDSACREVGFFYLKGHGIPSELIASMLANARDFFETSTQDEKDAIAIKNISDGGDNARGWLRVDNPEKGSHEAVDFYRPVDKHDKSHTTGLGENKWPMTPANLRAVSETYIEQLEHLGREVMRAMALALGIDVSLFLDRVDKAFWNLRILGYEGRKSRSPAPAGIGEHTDFGILTFLLTDSTKNSLQVLSKSGDWIWVDPVDGCFVCNIGDMLAEWTRNAYKSTMHRVWHTSDSLRISIPFFFDPNWDAFIAPVLPDAKGGFNAEEGIRYKDKFVQSVDYPLWRDPLVEESTTQW
ncbi:oxoglutarate 3-dioxygenase [Lophiostoma macrostomum CBS 122681]|uniref:Oxoglutarate 3-dioxygenase n=1 Tax=Lophiostoma macrostomum CBS 122681 TaxID=1314788 RepID=A0A6A6T1K2_9PLEO|nr:oxoglutarate 3-dioxygenase [Lophiostoma macrostomum CBS 122681]